MQILAHLYKGLEHLQILVSEGILQPMPCGYREMILLPVIIMELLSWRGTLVNF